MGFKELADMLQVVAPKKNFTDFKLFNNPRKVYKNEDYSSITNISAPLGQIESESNFSIGKDKDYYLKSNSKSILSLYSSQICE